MEGGVGQGTLLVSGNLTVRGSFVFRGLVVVGGGLVFDAGGGEIWGAVQVDDSSGVGTVLNGGRIVYSGCALRNALGRFGKISAIDRRAWIKPYQTP